ncbi:aluminum-activated malate transporter 8 [Pistacia vera]|uniref:aluminum-activated malate transporter 8 n=1 Tax=Pistacia vera TaxID=55513 RepID=UPI001263811A|nr:aluminum-activated malate transporter 8 [Pistacia vera]
MEIRLTTQEKSGFFARVWSWLKALPCSFRAKVIELAKSIKELGKNDPRRIIHSLKVGLALSIVSLLYYARPLYDGFGVAGMWAVLTVVVVFEFTVGGTLSRCLNRGFATLSAGALGVGAQHLASLSGEKGEPIVLGILVFLLAAASTFTRFFPRIKARYDYGVLIFILTFSLVAVSGYRVDELLVLAHQRLTTILIGGATCIIVSIFVCPVWAGEDLHELLVSNLEKLASYIEGFGGEYFQDLESSQEVVSKKDKSFLQGYKSVLTSKNTEESLANLARWEPGHGRFRLRHPWKQYLKIAGLARQCAYQIEALNGFIINSDFQIPPEFQSEIQQSCRKMSAESGKALKALASSIKTMADPSAANPFVEASKNAVKDLKITLKATTLSTNNIVDLQAIVPAATVASILIEIVKTVEKISDSVNELANLAHFKTVEATVSPELKVQPHNLLHRGSVQPVLDGEISNHVVIDIDEASDSPENSKENDGNISKAAKNGERVEIV